MASQHGVGGEMGHAVSEGRSGHGGYLFRVAQTAMTRQPQPAPVKPSGCQYRDSWKVTELQTITIPIAVQSQTNAERMTIQQVSKASLCQPSDAERRFDSGSDLRASGGC